MNDDELEDMLAKKAFGVCRRYPPVAVTHEDCGGFYGFRGDATDYFEFVHTEIGDWCGEFLPSNVENQRHRYGVRWIDLLGRFVSHVNPSNRNLLHTPQAYSKLNQRVESLNHLLGMDFGVPQIEFACFPMNI